MSETDFLLMANGHRPVVIDMRASIYTLDRAFKRLDSVVFQPSPVRQATSTSTSMNRKKEFEKQLCETVYHAILQENSFDCWIPSLQLVQGCA